MFTVEIFEPKLHYEMIDQWWHKQDWPPVPLSSLAPLGLLVKKDGEYLYCMFLYYACGTDLAWLEYIVGNPDVEPSKKRGALKFGIDEIMILGRNVYSEQIDSVFTTTLNPALANSLKKCDFIVGDQGMTQLIKKY